MSLFDHVSLVVRDLERSKAFYLRALEPLGVKLIKELGSAAGLGRGDGPDFWFGTGPSDFQAPEHMNLITPIHVAFAARHRGEVDAFHRAALAAGGVDNGPPGLRAHYHANYYAAFVLDPDGNNIEAVYHEPVR
jgi:catechol 2,3-dioxygenase-like lactoylglutathione lyase family enzyme